MVHIIDKIWQRRQEFQSQRRQQGIERAALEKVTETDSKLIGRNDDQTENRNPPVNSWYYSLEFFPPKTEAGLDNLLTRIDRMAQRLDPLFIDVTWGSPLTAANTMAVATHAQKYLGVDVLLHLSTTSMSREQIEQILQQAKASGIRNLLVLRGDPPRGKHTWNVGDVSGGYCDRAIDLVRFIRRQHDDYFGIAVAGHPEGHPSSTSPSEEIQHLLEKVQAGADFIVTQLFYDVDAFLEYVSRCRAAGIQCPILPGIMPIQSYNSFKRMTEYCQVAVPNHIWDRLEPVKDDDEAVKSLGCEIAVDMCRRILTETNGDVDGVHFYTLNLERSVSLILLEMGAIDVVDPTNGAPTESRSLNAAAAAHIESVRAAAGRKLPWRPSTMEKRSKKEQVRPINWANRPKSYVVRTEDWDEFPNGRWGDATSPAFGELSDVGHFYSFSLGSEDDQRAMLGHCPKTPQDIYDVFARYVEGRIPHIPWCETSLQPESFLIQPQLARLNRAGFLTINSQPSTNGVSSSHKTFGWGGPGGHIYQKAYCECFCSPEHTRRLVEMVKKRDTMNLYAVNFMGDKIQEGIELGGVTALTWGVFPNREILQPTIFDPNTFLVWSEEAFSLWDSMWMNLYDFDSPSYQLIETIRDTYYLCAIIDNDYISGSDKAEGGSPIWDAMHAAT
jgi:methylenetetrahydrofolate reductase (NADPH)